MIAVSVAERTAGVVRETGEDQQVIAVRLERLKNTRKLIPRAFGGRCPLLHHNSIRNVNVNQAARGLCCCCESWKHGLDLGKCDGCSQATQQSTARNGSHCPATSPRRFSNGALATI